MGLKSRTKGKLGEREAAKYLRSLGYESARRSVQFKGTSDGSDIVCDELPQVFIEVKYGYPRSVFDVGSTAWRAACDLAYDTAGGRAWCVLWKPKGCREWRLTCSSNLGMTTVTGDYSITKTIDALNTSRSPLGDIHADVRDRKKLTATG